MYLTIFCTHFRHLPTCVFTYFLFPGLCHHTLYTIGFFDCQKYQHLNLRRDLSRVFFAKNTELHKSILVYQYVGLKYAIHIERASLLPILILGLINTGIGCYFYFSSIGDLPVQSVAICGYLEPLSAVFFSTILPNEK